MSVPPPFSKTSLRILLAVALLYAFLAGLRTVSDTDTGWHLAGGRHIWQTRQIPSVDVMSYTAEGKPWIYPVASQLLLYFLFTLGGWAALSYLNAAACTATVALLLRRGRWFTTVLAIFAVPSIAHRTVPRGDLFTMILFAWFLRLLMRHSEGERVRLWLLPVLMLAWVNLHLGFGAGIALLVAYAGFEALEMIFPARREAAWVRLKTAAPWMGVALLAVLVNPWGAGIFKALVRQGDLIKYYGTFFNEWTSIPFQTGWNEATSWRNPESGYWWLLAVGMGAAIAFLLRGRLGPAILLAGVAMYSVLYVRFQPLLVIAVVALAESAFLAPRAEPPSPAPVPSSSTLPRSALAWTGLLALLVFTSVRMMDIVTNRYSLSSGQTSVFGAGLSWWFPESAAEFIAREKLPANIFHDYNTGGYLNWRLGPAYKTYVDGRAIPFGPELFFRQRALLGQSPDSPEWQEEIAKRNIQTILLPVGRYLGLGSFPLAAYCQSKEWQPVYLDTSALVMVRRGAFDADRLATLSIDCNRAALLPEASALAARPPAQRYNMLLNAASIEFVLARDAEALRHIQAAEALFWRDSNLYLLKGQLYQARGEFPAAETALRTSIAIRPTDAALLSLSLLYSSQRRYAAAVPLLEAAIRISQVPYDRLLTLGQVKVGLSQPDEALAHFAEAEARSPYRGAASSSGTEFNARLAESRARAWRLKGDSAKAVEFAERSTQLTPGNERRWNLLADLYESAGQAAKAQEARRTAEQRRQAQAQPPARLTP